MAKTSQTISREFLRYFEEESEAILKRGEVLLTADDLAGRWRVSRREIFAMARGEHPRVHLPAYRFSRKQVRFRLLDILCTEHQLRTKDT